MRLGIGADIPHQTPEEWASALAGLGCGTAVFPVSSDCPRGLREEYLAAARAHGLTIGEVGIWKNTLSPDPKERAAAVEFAREQLALAEETGARCCVNILGNAGEGAWDQYSPANETADTYALAVDTVRGILDAVKPARTFYTLECMPWMHPDSPEDYLRLLRDVDRPAFAVHLDYANMVNGISRYRKLPQFIADCFRLLGPRIKSVHAKDIRLENALPCCIREIFPGEGAVDFGLVLRLAESLGKETPVFVEHLPSFAECGRAAAYLRGEARRAGVEALCRPA